MSKTLSPLEQVLVDTIQKASNVTGEVYDAAKGVTTRAIDFASEQIPDVIHQLLVWKLAESLAYVVLGLSIILIFFWTRSRVKAYVEADDGDKEIVLLYTVFCGGLSFSIGGMFMFYNLLDVIKIWFAPKIFLIEYAADLLK